MKIKQILNGLVNYLAAIGLALVFALFLSGRIGWFILAAFICAPIISLLLTVLFIPRIYSSFDISAPVLCKGDSCEITVTVSSGCFLPSPPIIFEISDCPSAVCSDKRFSVSVMPFSEESFNVKYTAKICGPCTVGAASVKIFDYFGIFSFTPKNIDIGSLCGEISVIPDIADISPDDAAVKRAALLAADADDSEDTAESAYNTFGGFPGYDSREYVPGDPLKRINWKQSAKRGKMLVRLDDEVMSSSAAVVLDSVFCHTDVFLPALLENERFSDCTAENVIPYAAQYAVESALGIIKAFLDRKYSVVFIMTGKNGWQTYTAADESDITRIRTDLASYRFICEKGKQRFPFEELSSQKGSVSVFCTPYLDEELNAQLSEYTGDSAGKGALRTVIYPGAVSPRLDIPREADADEN